MHKLLSPSLGALWDTVFWMDILQPTFYPNKHFRMSEATFNNWQFDRLQFSQTTSVETKLSVCVPFSIPASLKNPEITWQQFPLS